MTVKSALNSAFFGGEVVRKISLPYLDQPNATLAHAKPVMSPQGRVVDRKPDPHGESRSVIVRYRQFAKTSQPEVRSW